MELDVLNDSLGKQWVPLAQKVKEAPLDLFADIERTEYTTIIEYWQDAFEWSYYDSVLKGLLLAGQRSLLEYAYLCGSIPTQPQL